MNNREVSTSTQYIWPVHLYSISTLKGREILTILVTLRYGIVLEYK